MNGLSDNPMYSVVIPCYNEASYIADTLKSLQAQKTTATFEILVVDNNCTDETADIAKSFGVKVVPEKTPGVSAARQAGTKVASGQIVISTDADTTFSPEWLETIHQDFLSHPNAIAVCGPCQYVNGPEWSEIYTTTLFSCSAWYAAVFGHPFYVSATNIAFKKTAWHGYNVNLPQGGDELGLLHDLKRQGIVRFNNSNPTYTSSRRLEKGFFYSFFVTFLYYYIIGYNLDRIFRRSIIGSAPSFRKSLTPTRYIAKKRQRLAVVAGGVITALAALSVYLSPNHLTDVGSDIFSFVQRLFG